MVIGGVVTGLFVLGLSLDLFDTAQLHLLSAGFLDEVLAAALLMVVGLAFLAIRGASRGAREQHLRLDTEQQYRTLVEQVPATTYTSDATRPAGIAPILYMSPQVERLLGYPAQAWLDDPGLWLRCIHPEDRERVVQASDLADSTGEIFAVEYRGLRRDGDIVWIRDESNIVAWDEHGRPLVAQGVMWDITPRKLAELALQGAEERYRLLVEQLPVSVYTDAVDEVSTALYISPRYEHLTGYSPDERIAHPNLWVEILHPDDRERVLAESDRTNRTGDPFDLEYRIVHADGRTVWLHDHAILVDGPGGRPIWQGVLTDITDRKLAQEALGRRDRILEAAAFAAEMSLNAPSWEAALGDVLERLGTAVEASRAYLYRNDVDPTDGLIMTVVDEWVGPESTSSLEVEGNRRWPYDDGYSRWVEILGAGGVIHGLWHQFPENERRDLEVEGTLSLCVVPVSVAGEWWGYIGFDQCDEDRVWLQSEIEALRVVGNTLGAAINREAAARALAEAEARFRGIVEHVPAAIYLDRADRSMKSVYVSPQIEDITGISQNEWTEDPEAWIKVMHADDRDRVIGDYLASVDARAPWTAEYRVHTRDGRTIWVHDETTFIYDAEGSAAFLQGVIFDVTERKLAEQALLESEHREREAAARLRALDEMKNTFLAAVSHELRSPLTSILGLALTLERGGAMAERDRTDLLARLGTNARKLERLLKDLLDIDRLNRGIVEPQYRMADVGELAMRAVENLEVLSGRVVHVSAQPVTVAVDPPKVERIVENLLTNAARHTTSDRRIWLRVEPMDGGVTIAVEDDGPGVPPDMRESIFEPFRQGPTAAAHAPGTGIGLSLVARFSELHGGRAWVEEREGGGASFRVHLPAAPVALPAEEGRIDRTAVATVPLSAGI